MLNYTAHITDHEQLGITDTDICSWFSVLGSAHIDSKCPLNVIKIELNAPLKISIIPSTTVSRGFLVPANTANFLGSTVARYEMFGKCEAVGFRYIYSIYPVLTLRLPYTWFCGVVGLLEMHKAEEHNGILQPTSDGNGNFTITDIKRWHREVTEAFALHLFNHGIVIFEQDEWQFTTETKINKELV